MDRLKTMLLGLIDRMERRRLVLDKPNKNLPVYRFTLINKDK